MCSEANKGMSQIDENIERFSLMETAVNATIHVDLKLQDRPEYFVHVPAEIAGKFNRIESEIRRTNMILSQIMSVGDTISGMKRATEQLFVAHEAIKALQSATEKILEAVEQLRDVESQKTLGSS